MVSKVYATILSIETYMENEGKRNCKRQRNLIRKSQRRFISIACTATAMNAELDKRSNIVPFDSDSAPIGVDNRCSACISHILKKFIGNYLVDSSQTIKGFAGSKTTGITVGMLRWYWLDDAMVEYTFKIPKLYYVPHRKVQLLIPQHWAKRNNGKSGNKKFHGTLLQTTSKSVTSCGNDYKSKLTIHLSKKNNIATFHLAPGFDNYFAFCSDTRIDTNHDRLDPLVCLSAIEVKGIDDTKAWSENLQNIPFHNKVQQ